MSFIWGFHDSETAPAKVGDEPYRDAVDVPQDYRSGCGKCGAPGKFGPYPESVRFGEGEDAHDPFPVVYGCNSCGYPHIVVFEVDLSDAMPQLKNGATYPTAVARPIRPKEYRGTVIEKCRDEAWASYFAGRHRSAMVMARSALQALVRRYLPKSKWGNFGAEATTLAEEAGKGWDAVGVGVRTIGNRWAHPDPTDEVEPTRAEAREALDRLEEVLEFTAAMERVGHLTPVTGEPS